MRSTLLISDVSFKPATSARDAGLAGYIQCTAGGELRLRGLTLRRTAQGAHAISFPARRDKLGVRFFYMQPLDQAARDAITEQVLAELRRQGAVQ